jgi:protein-disulfide isomerase
MFGKYFVALLITVLPLFACSPPHDSIDKYLQDNPEVLEDAIEQHLTKHPETLFIAIEQNPESFMAAAHKASLEQKRQRRQQQLDEAFANPKTPEIVSKRVIFGNPDAPVTIVEYSDFQCPYCAKVTPTLTKVMTDYGDRVRLVYKHMPLDFHDLSKPAATYFEAIALQDQEKAREFHDALFDNQQAFSQQGESYLQQTAQGLGVDMEKLSQDLQSDQVTARIDADIAEAQAFGFQGTPAFLINGVPISGARPYEEFEAIIDRHLAANQMGINAKEN